MKYSLLALLFVGSISQAYEQTFPIPAQLGMSTASPFILTLASSGVFDHDKDLLAVAQEDAVKFAATQGKTGITLALKDAIEEVKLKLWGMGFEMQSQMDAVYAVMLINTVNAQRK